MRHCSLISHQTVALHASNSGIRRRHLTLRSMHAETLLLTLAVVLLAQQGGCTAGGTLGKWLDEAHKIESWITDRQQELHKIPELLFNTTKTYAALEIYLTDLGIKHR